MIKFLVVDLIIFIVFCVAAIIGYQRSYRISLVNLVIQLFSIFLSALVAGALVNKVVSYLPKKLKVSSFVPDSFYYLIEPYEENIIPFIVFFILFVVVFVIIKSVVYVFSVNYEWHQYFFPSAKFNRIGDGLLSVLLSVLNAYTYVIVIVIILAFPLFDFVRPYSLSNLLLKVNPYVSHLVEEFYQPYEDVKKSIDLFGDELDNLFANNKVNLDQLEQFIKKHPNQRQEIQVAFKEFLPFMATTSTYLSFFPDNKIDADEMEAYLTSMKTYINHNVITLEIFNSYYKELIRNGTYDRLIEDEVISDEALKTLINSGMLNDDNLKKLKNM
ncbi:hypothetical protein [Turicibacter bilis]|uniref:hypothetical protein n=1 Tax=Turicibacter bilis TaxID=2735723 RepID=UPI0031BA4277